MQLGEQRADRPRRVVHRVKNKDPDFRDTVGRSVTLPVDWWERIEAVAKARETDDYSARIQLVCSSLDEAGFPPTPPKAEIEGEKRTSTVLLAARRWEQLSKESDARGLSLNKVFQSHLFRALVDEEAEIAAERKTKR